MTWPGKHVDQLTSSTRRHRTHAHTALFLQPILKGEAFLNDSSSSFFKLSTLISDDAILALPSKDKCTVKAYPATAAAVADPQKNMEARERRVAILHTTA